MIKKQASKVFSTARAQIKTCSASKETIVFSYAHICKDDKHNFNCFKKNKQNSKMAERIKSLSDKLSELSNLTWENFNALPKKSGSEYLPVGQWNKTFINSLDYSLTDDDKLISVRFDGQDCRLVLKRGTKCGRVAHILGIDLNLDLYNH